MAVEIADGPDFPVLAQKLFGNVRLHFPQAPAHARRLTSAVLGEARVSELEAGSHAVFGERVVRASHDPDSLKLLIQAEGSSLITQGGRTVDFGDGMPVLYDPTQAYTLINRTHVRLMMLQVPRHAFSRVALASLLTPRLPHGALGGLWHVLLSTMQSSLREAGRLDEASRVNLGRTLVEMVRPIVEAETPGQVRAKSLDVLLTRTKVFIETHLEQPDLSVEKIAARMGCTPRYIFRAFETQGVTPSQFIWEARLKRARADLGSAGCAARSISAIAFSLGFSSSAHFSRAFRQRFEISPRDFRRSAGVG
ncbi:helix-turn-helix domain-containing protein [Rhizobium setariae]|uniref:helix-turn-helix domain-containing protein n=1 Tax=Rhizobium setariae TaxID=2801340 RepID=UPI0031BB6954